MLIDYLTNKEFEYLKSLLSQNKGMSHIEYQNLKSRHPYAVEREDNQLIHSKMKHYGLDNDLSKFINDKFGKPEYEIDFLYELTYNENDYTIIHKDAYFVLQTTLILLSDSFEGGKLMIDEKDVNFNKIGQYINFNGHDQTHEVTQVESGQRRVLVIMFNKKKELF